MPHERGTLYETSTFRKPVHGTTARSGGGSTAESTEPAAGFRHGIHVATVGTAEAEHGVGAAESGVGRNAGKTPEGATELGKHKHDGRQIRPRREGGQAP